MSGGLIFTNSPDKRLATAPRSDSLDRIPNDVLLDCVMMRLNVLDIIHLRQVSKRYYELSHHAALWKHILRTTNLALPPVPPTLRHSDVRMTGLEAERMVCRALSLQKNWKRKSPRCFLHWTFDAYCRVLEMTLLPGGRYLVASVSDPTGQKCALVVYALDTFGSSRLIAKTDLATKAYEIRATYVTIQGQKSLAIAYLRRDYHHKSDRRKAAQGLLLNVSEYSSYHDIDVEFRHECVAIHARLFVLEELADLSSDIDTTQFFEKARDLPPPFENLVRITSGPQHRLMCPDIAEMFDSAYLAVAKFPNDIIYKRLDGGPAATVTCLPLQPHAHSTHVVKAMRLVPQEGTAFVVREISVPLTQEQRWPIYAFEMHGVIPAGETKTTHVQSAQQWVTARDLGHLSHIQIADLNLPPRDDNSILGKLRRASSDTAAPSPLSVYGCRLDEQGCILMRFFPHRFVIEAPPTPPSEDDAQPLPVPLPEPERRVEYRYILSHNDAIKKGTSVQERVRILPGIFRPLMVRTRSDNLSYAPPIEDISPWMHSKIQGGALMLFNGIAFPKECHPRHAKFANMPWPKPEDPELRASAFAWDETIGRLVVANTNTDDLYVYDFAHAPRRDYQGHRLPLPLRDIPNPDILYRPSDHFFDAMHV